MENLSNDQDIKQLKKSFISIIILHKGKCFIYLIYCLFIFAIYKLDNVFYSSYNKELILSNLALFVVLVVYSRIEYCFDLGIFHLDKTIMKIHKKDKEQDNRLAHQIELLEYVIKHISKVEVDLLEFKNLYIKRNDYLKNELKDIKEQKD